MVRSTCGSYGELEFGSQHYVKCSQPPVTAAPVDPTPVTPPAPTLMSTYPYIHAYTLLKTINLEN